MIQEVIVSTQNADKQPHIAPMGIHLVDNEIIILPFRPSTTLNNILQTGHAVINYCDDVRVFAGCLTGRRDWPLVLAEKIKGHYLAAALAHKELELLRIEDDETRPKLYCRTLHSVNHKPFQGFNRAQSAVLEAAILVSRLNMLPVEKIESELAYLSIGLNKTAGVNEQQAWDWLMQIVEQYIQGIKAL